MKETINHEEDYLQEVNPVIAGVDFTDTINQLNNL